MGRVPEIARRLYKPPFKSGLSMLGTGGGVIKHAEDADESLVATLNDDDPDSDWELNPAALYGARGAALAAWFEKHVLDDDMGPMPARELARLLTEAWQA